MSIETKGTLTEETIKKLQQLIRVNIDSYDGFRESAVEIEDAALAELFRDLADDRSQMATELQDYVEWNGEEPVEEGSFAASVHRAWINVRSKLNGGDAYVILVEAERGEDHIKNAYEDALLDTAGSAMNDVLMEQYARVKAGHDRIRDLRDSYKRRK
jgi:uncharacterized protein (TIGR02284 family)